MTGNQQMAQNARSDGMHYGSIHLIGDRKTNVSDVCRTLGVEPTRLKVFTRTDRFSADVMLRRTDLVVVDIDADGLTGIEYLIFLATYFQLRAPFLLVTRRDEKHHATRSTGYRKQGVLDLVHPNDVAFA
jgi:response regulator RpfG family c-di-GMP phosphodiesterase